MKNMNIKAIVLGFMVLAVLPLSAAGMKAEGSGKLSTLDCGVNNFSRLYVSGIDDVIITYGQDWNVSVTTDDNLINNITVTPKNTYLNVAFEKRDHFNPSVVKAEITVPYLSELTLSTGTHAVLSGSSIPVDMDVTVRNHSSLTSGLLSADTLTLNVTDNSDVNGVVSASKVIARVREAFLNISGDTEYLKLDADDSTLALKNFSIVKALIDLDDECIADITLANLNVMGSSSSTELEIHGESDVVFTTEGDLAAVVDGDSDLDYAYSGSVFEMDAEATSSIRRL